MSIGNILVVNDESSARDSLCKILSQEGYEVDNTGDGHSALKQLRKKQYSVVLTKGKMPGMDGIELLKQIKNNWMDTEVILMTGNGSVPNAIEAMKLGAFHYLDKFNGSCSKLKQVIKEALGDEKQSDNSFHNFIGKNYHIQELYTLIKTVAGSNVTVLIGGETGTGKNLVAKAIHHQSPRRERNFVKVDCAGIPEELLESDLFGHIRGSFTTAVRDKKGKFELADKGTLFLDDIDCLPMKLQAKLLRVLQDREFEKVGGIATQEVDVRVIAASNQDLQEAVTKGTFRADLFYRLNVIGIYLPPLRDRLDDLKELSYHFLEICNHKNHTNIIGISDEAFDMMKRYPWPGNVRELENAVERAVVLKQKGYIEPEDLRLPQDESPSPEVTFDDNLSLKDYLKAAEKNKILDTLEKNNWKRNQTAQALGISRITLYSKMKEYGLQQSYRNR